MFNEKATDFFEQANAWDKVRPDQKPKRKKRRGRRSVTVKSATGLPFEYQDPEYGTAFGLAMGHGMNLSNTGNLAVVVALHAEPEPVKTLVQSEEHAERLTDELRMLEARKAKKRAKSKRRKDNKRARS